MKADARRPRVVLVDDHPAVLRQTIQLLSNEFEVVDALDDAAQCSATVHDLEPDLIVLDITLPGLSGIELALRLKASGCTAKIVFLTVHADPDYVRESFTVGASGYVVKPRLGSDLIPALRAAMLGHRFVSPCPELQEMPDSCGREQASQ
jgi:DNA-binding NarL/FixJ family response regulator